MTLNSDLIKPSASKARKINNYKRLALFLLAVLIVFKYFVPQAAPAHDTLGT